MHEKDDFWDISSLLPPKRRPAPSAPPHPKPQEISFGEERGKGTEKTHSLFAQEGERELFCEYTPSWNSLLHKVRVFRQPNTYKLYHLFRADAIRYLGEKGSECPYVPCFSYIPQYSQLNSAQKAYYLYFRDEANKGNYLKTNQSYFLLYVYEIINLPDYIPPKTGVLRMATAWRAYRDVLTGIEKYMTAWLSDYALLHGVACPSEVLQPFLSDVLSTSALKEFYLGNEGSLSSCQMDAFLTLSSDYQYKNGRYVRGVDSEQSELFLKHISAAVGIVLEKILDNEAKESSFQTVHKEYPAYIGALCAEPYRYTVEISYCSVSGTEALRTLLTSVVKYAENKVRAALSIKSRLSVPGLSPEYRELIDAYFSTHLPVIKANKPNAKRNESEPSYEKMYDALSYGFSSAEAESIEESSWENTRMLISEEEAKEVFLSAKGEEKIPASSTEAPDSPLALCDIKLLAALLRGGTSAARAYAADEGMLLEGAVERINEYFVDTMGDIVIEESESDLSLIEDYETEVLAFLAPYTDDGKL